MCCEVRPNELIPDIGLIVPHVWTVAKWSPASDYSVIDGFRGSFYLQINLIYATLSA